MRDIATAFAAAQLLADRATETAQKAPQGLSQSGVPLADVAEDGAVHCFDRWYIFKAEPNREGAALKSLVREGFECWYPAGRKVKAKPQRMISSKTRHKKRHVLVEDVRLPYPGYLFVRAMTERAARLDYGLAWQLDGVVGVCMFGDRYAMAEDYEIQMMRFREDIGSYDVWDVTMNAKQFGLAVIERTEAAEKRWNTPPKLIGTLDSNRSGSLHLVEAFGRITRVITETGDLHIPR